MLFSNSYKGVVLEDRDLSEDEPAKVFTRSFEVSTEVRLHYHKALEVNHFLGAEGLLTLGGQRYDISSLSSLIIPPDYIHSYSLPPQSGKILVTLISIPHLSHWIDEDSTNSFLRAVPESKLTFRDRDSGPSKLVETTPFGVMSYLYGIMALLGDGRSKPSIPPRKFWLRDVIERTEVEFAKQLELEDMAETAHMTRTAFSRAFRRETGQSYHSYLVQVRLEHSIILLSQGATVTEVAAESGFADASHFILRFKKMYGVTPKQYQQTLLP